MISARAAANLHCGGWPGRCLGAIAIFSARVLILSALPFYALTGHYCPGCGATRAIAELLHGHVAAALHFNAAVTLLIAHAASGILQRLLDGGARQSCRVAASPQCHGELRLPASCSLA